MLCMDVEGKLTLLKTREAQIARQPDNWQRVTCYINFQGEATIARKAEWPGWRPTPDMIARDPDRYGPLKEGLPGGTGNPSDHARSISTGITGTPTTAFTARSSRGPSEPKCHPAVSAS